MKKIEFRHYERSFILGGYKDIKLFEYVELAIDKFGGEELKSTDGTIIYCPKISTDILGVAFHEKLLSTEAIQNYEKDKYIQKKLRELKIDRDKMAYLLLWTCFCAENLSRTKLVETKYEKFSRAIEFINNLSSEKIPSANVKISSGKRGKNAAIIFDDIESILFIGKALSECLKNHISESAQFKIEPIDSSTSNEFLDIEDKLTDKTKQRFFYEVIDWFLKEHRNKQGISKPKEGINHDWIISRLAWLFGIANTNYKDGGLNNSWK